MTKNIHDNHYNELEKKHTEEINEDDRNKYE